MKSVKYLEAVKQKHGIKTDAALATLIGVSGAAISHYLNGRRVMDEETCLAVALELEINPMEIIMAAGIDRAEKTGQQSLWTVFSKRMAAPVTSALLVGFVTLFLTTPIPSEAKTTTINNNINYAKLMAFQKWALRQRAAYGISYSSAGQTIRMPHKNQILKRRSAGHITRP